MQQLLSALRVAYAILIFVFDPRDFDKISFTPASSNTALTGPPAFTPVPFEAGFNITQNSKRRKTHGK